MNRIVSRILFFLLGLIGLSSLLCSIAASGVTNAALMKQGFLQYAETEHLGVSPTRYADYAAAISDCLDGKTDAPRIPDGEGNTKDAFTEKENAHLRDVRGIVTFLKWARWLGGGGTIAIIAAMYLLSKNRQQLLSALVRAFALAALFLLFVFTILAVWGAFNFDGLFWTFHKIFFTNTLWLLNPKTDLLMALMPLSFFTWYAGEILKSLLPVLGLMLLLIIAWLKTSKEKKQ